MAALLWLAANVVMVIFIVKTAKEKDQVKKKSKRQIIGSITNVKLLL